MDSNHDIAKEEEERRQSIREASEAFDKCIRRRDELSDNTSKLIGTIAVFALGFSMQFTKDFLSLDIVVRWLLFSSWSCFAFSLILALFALKSAADNHDCAADYLAKRVIWLEDLKRGTEPSEPGKTRTTMYRVGSIYLLSAGLVVLVVALFLSVSLASVSGSLSGMAEDPKEPRRPETKDLRPGAGAEFKGSFDAKIPYNLRPAQAQTEGEKESSSQGTSQDAATTEEDKGESD